MQIIRHQLLSSSKAKCRENTWTILRIVFKASLQIQKDRSIISDLIITQDIHSTSWSKTRKQRLVKHLL